MDREILFRGKRTDNNSWVSGFYWEFTKDDKTVSVMRTQMLTNVIVDTSTIGQYTGLTDKNGRKIFEGDIVEIPHENELFVMAWDDDLARFICSGETVNFDFDSFYGNQIIVLGNIHDDSELLEVTDNGN